MSIQEFKKLLKQVKWNDVISCGLIFIGVYALLIFI
jgi:hypothetical protein